MVAALVVCALLGECVSGEDTRSAAQASTARRDAGGDDFEDPEEEGDEDSHQYPCEQLRAAVDQRRTAQQREAARRAVRDLRRELHHRHVPLSELVAYVSPLADQGRPADPVQAQNLDALAGWMLCDPLTRELTTRSFLAGSSGQSVGARSVGIG